MCDIGKKLFNRRKELGLTLEEVGNAVGVGKSTVRKWENGMIKNMGRDKLIALAKVLQMSAVELVPVEPKPSKNMMDLSETEHEIILAFRQADPSTRSAVCAVLHVDEVKTPAQESSMG